MEDPAPYNIHLKKFFHNANESGPMKAKRMGDNIVPLGCFNDPGDRLEAFIERINDSVFPLLQQLELSILEGFSNVRVFFSEIPNDVILFGTQLIVDIWSEIWNDEAVEEEYPVWYYRINNESEVLETSIRHQLKDRLSKNIMALLNHEYDFEKFY